MKENIAQVVATVVLGFIFSSGIAILEESTSLKLIANDDDNRQIQTVDKLNAEPIFPPPPPPPPGGGLTE